MTQVNAASASVQGPSGRSGDQAMEDALLTLGGLAARTHRRNRPVALVMLGALLLAGGGVYAGWAALSQRSAHAAAVRAQAEHEEALRQAARLKALMDAEAAQGSGRSSVESQATNILSRIENAGTQAGLSKPVGVSTPNVIPDRASGWRQMRYAYNIRDLSLDAILRFAQLVEQDIPGMEVYSLVVRPEASEWSVTIVFMRWERPEGSA